MYLADRTAAECKSHVEVYTDGSTKLKEQTMAWSVILKTESAPRPATYAMGRVRKLGSTLSMLAELVAIVNALVKVAANVDMTLYTDSKASIEVIKPCRRLTDMRERTRKPGWVLLELISHRGWKAKFALQIRLPIQPNLPD
jgi:ribonuclease HI